MSEESLAALAESITSPSSDALTAARSRLDSLTKPPGSLGALEDIVARLAAIQGTVTPALLHKRAIVMAGDHGVVAKGVSPYPQDVTTQMVANFAAGGAAVNQLAEWTGADVVVVDMGVAGDLRGVPGVVFAKVGPGTADMSEGPAMTREQALDAIGTGLGLAQQALDDGVDILALGEMGIGNTTAAAALTCAFTGLNPSDTVGPGTGLDQQGVARKAEIVARALQVNVDDLDEPLGVVAALGGYEIAGLAGVAIGAAVAGIPVVADGFISGTAALAGVRIAEKSRAYVFPSHLSAEPGHAAVLSALKLDPVLDLDMRLGEGTGAVLAIGIMDAACRVMSGMATFEQAGVSERETT